MSKHDKMKCVFCFKKLSHADICFETLNDQVEESPDEIRLNFLRMTDPIVGEYDQQAMTRKPIVAYKEGDPAFELDPETGIPVAWNEPLEDGMFTLKSKRRLCAYCHMPLPSEFGKRPNVMIGISGNTGAGKTVYMLSLIHDLRIKIQDMFIIPDPVFFWKLKTDYESMCSAMYKDPYRLPLATDPNDPMSPLVLNCSCGSTEFMLTLYDMPSFSGQWWRERSVDPQFREFLESCDGVIYLKDADVLPGMPKAEWAGLWQFEKIAYLNEIVRYTRLAITLSKADKLLDMYGDNPDFRNIVGPMFRDRGSVHEQGFDRQLAMECNQRMYNLYNWTNTSVPDILHVHDRNLKVKKPKVAPAPEGLLARLFPMLHPAAKVEKPDPTDRNIMLFGASALGRNATVYQEDGDSVSYASQMPDGLNNVDPVLWLLYCAGVFPAKREED